MDNYLSDDRFALYTCLVQGVRVGLLLFDSLDEYWQRRIIRIAVREECRHQGIGRFMINEFIKIYGDILGYRSMRVFTSLLYDDSVGFFRKCGFREIPYDATDCSGNQWSEYHCYIDI